MFGIFRKLFRRSSGSHAALQPESQFIVRLSDSDVVCDRPDGGRERVAWDDLQSVKILSTSDGPLLPDTFWVLCGSASGCVIPWGATGDRELLERLQKLPHFNNMAVINCARTTDDAMTLCWERSTNVS